MNVSICALKGDLQRDKPPGKCFQSYKVTRITKREQELCAWGFSCGNDQSVFIIAGYLVIVIIHALPAARCRCSVRRRITSCLRWRLLRLVCSSLRGRRSILPRRRTPFLTLNTARELPSAAATCGGSSAPRQHFWTAADRGGRRSGHAAPQRTEPLFTLSSRSFGAASPLRRRGERTEGRQRAERGNDGGQRDVNYLQTWHVRLGAGAALRGGVGS